jgi:hypothetical protein
MAEALNYVYEPVYGAEPYQDNSGAGGARLTQQNLVVSAWQVGKKFDTPPNYFDWGSILKPVSQNNSNGNSGAPLNETDGVAAGLQAFRSRHSFKAFFLTADDSYFSIGFIINPPPEMKQLLQGSVSYNGGDPTDPTSYTVNKSLQSSYAWTFRLDVTAEAHNIQEFDSAAAVFSTYLWLNDQIFDASVARVPFLKTNGADGVAPVFFDASIAGGVNEMVEAVNDGGEYYIAFSMPFEVGEENDIGNYFTVEYPHSAARA